ARDVPFDVESLDPRAGAVLHEVRVPVEFFAAAKEGLTVLERSHEPLARGDDLQGSFAAFVELDGVGDLTKFAHQIARGAKRVHDRGARLVDGPSLYLGVDRVGGEGISRREGLGAKGRRQEPAVSSNQGARGQTQFAPPRHVVSVATGADD